MTDQQTPKGVVALVQSNVGTRKTRILLAATELFVGCDAPDNVESHVFAELFRQYITETPIEERRRIASLLARCAHAPHETVLTLMRDEDASVAHRVVAYSPLLTHCDLVAAVGRGPEAVRRAVTLRPDLAPDVIAALQRHAAPETLAGLSIPGRHTTGPHAPETPADGPTNIVPAADAPRKDAPRADTERDAELAGLLAEIRSDIRDYSGTRNDTVAEEPGARETMAPEQATDDSWAEPLVPAPAESTSLAPVAPAPEIAATAGTPSHTDESTRIEAPVLQAAADAPAAAPRPAPSAGDLSFLHADSTQRTRAITAAQSRIMAEMAARSGARVGTRASLRAGTPTSDIDQDMLRCLEQSAMARDKESFLGLLAPLLDVDTATAEHIMLDAGGEPLTVALAALGLKTSRSIAVMIQMSPAVHGIQRLREISALRANLDMRTAQAIAGAWRRTPQPAPEAAHQPHLDASQRPQRGAGIAETAKPRFDKSDVLVLRDVVN
ncbi:hypothetical protein [Breoghania sp. L-A4]|uniref:hypothetical protein n=1 Tax=Breoghania sp. L-A4 TaxID=2304600 RepID=UPI000E35BD25|nr:hypothetical protein [Breoghania sp. L-A4]AXS39940.1 hypothetical protein D1F64_07560 [Breoghania sp. L-A4]